jgi:hypothetical protein
MKRTLTIALLLVHWIYMGTRPATVVRRSNETIHVVNPFQYINEAKGVLQEGDLVVRLHTDPFSQYIKTFNRKDKKYSHAGIVLFEGGRPYVYHIVNGSENPREKLRRDSLDQFCDPRRNTSFGIFRYQLSPAERLKLRLVIHQWYLQGLHFDNRFDLATDRKMYCSEMVSKALCKATGNRINIPPTKLNKLEAGVFATYSKTPFDSVKQKQIIAIDDLYTQAGCKAVKEYRYIE